MKIKVCGLTDHPANREIAQMAGIDLLGFIFYERSKRFTQQTIASDGKNRVGVFVNATSETIRTAIRTHTLDIVQLHGDETPELCRELRTTAIVIKAVGIANEIDFRIIPQYYGTVDYLLFDTKTPEYGGSGVVFPWEVLRNYTGETPFFLSGGIGPESVPELKQLKHTQLAGIDLNSRFETAPGIKDPVLVRQFLTALNT